ncbi:Glycosyl transferase family 2 [Synechococcus sp. PCC 7502]|uniref:glycosyltransferase family 2 protein n=1 Tax=Synechococcus sp. PCC 7502 TaxID=1173263 RepID=UPI00029FEDA0|nr:glycosyltransferase family 2 protein [Synechococcus sp. PCC 7502]AFY74468.1 Glycosyl transferase family 2 [Synechococcus sp. PCC 7502]
MSNNDFKIHSICLVKNEVDIIDYCLEQACQWSDYIYVYDNGSTDGTWEKVLSIQNEQIIPWKQDDKAFQESLRGEVFNAFRHRSKAGDWWCRLDADEFYIESPHTFLAKVNPLNHVIWGIAVEYYLTIKDIDLLDFNQPIPSLLLSLRFYKIENSEIRFFKYRDGLIWDSDQWQWPKHLGVVNKERIFYKHYKYRTPEQIQKRLDTRRLARERGFPGWDHALEKDWRKKIANSEQLNYDNQDGNFIIDTAKLPNHLESLPKRMLKTLAHSVGLWP